MHVSHKVLVLGHMRKTIRVLSASPAVQTRKVFVGFGEAIPYEDSEEFTVFKGRMLTSFVWLDDYVVYPNKHIYDIIPL
jgi:hypothetical protein